MDSTNDTLLAQVNSKSDKAYSVSSTLLLLLLGVTLAARFTSLTLNVYWYDELFGIYGATLPLPKSIAYFWKDVHPPFWPLLNVTWLKIAGNSELPARMLTATIGSLAIPLTYYIYRPLMGERSAYYIAGLTCILPIHIYYSQELRSYSLGYIFVILVTAFLLRYSDTPDKKNRWLFATSCGLLVGTHYLGILYVASACLAALISLNWNRGNNAIKNSSQLIATVFFTTAPFLPHFIIRRLELTEFPGAQVTWDIVIKTLNYPFMNKTLALAYSILVLAGILLAIKRKQHIKRIVIVSLLVTLPICGIIIASLLSPDVSVFVPRKVAILYCSPILVLAGIGFSTANHAGHRAKMAALASFILLATLSARALYINNYYTEPTKRIVARGIIELQTELKKVDSEDTLFVSLDPWQISSFYSYYVNSKDGYSGHIEIETPDSTLPELTFFLQKAQQEGKKRLVLFNFSYMKTYHPLAEEADMTLDIMNAHMQIGPEEGALVIYDLGSLAQEQPGSS